MAASAGEWSFFLCFLRLCFRRSSMFPLSLELMSCFNSAGDSLMNSAPSRLNGFTSWSTLFRVIFSCKHLKLSGFKSLANTIDSFLPAGTANGPTPANTSHTTSLGLKYCVTSLSCSVCRREFQYTLLKSNLNTQLDSRCSTIKLPSPAITFIGNVLNLVAIELTLSTTHVILVFLSMITWPISESKGLNSLRRFKCAM